MWPLIPSFAMSLQLANLDLNAVTHILRLGNIPAFKGREPRYPSPNASIDHNHFANDRNWPTLDWLTARREFKSNPICARLFYFYPIEDASVPFRTCWPRHRIEEPAHSTYVGWLVLHIHRGICFNLYPAWETNQRVKWTVRGRVAINLIERRESLSCCVSGNIFACQQDRPVDVSDAIDWSFLEDCRKESNGGRWRFSVNEVPCVFVSVRTKNSSKFERLHLIKPCLPPSPSLVELVPSEEDGKYLNLPYIVAICRSRNLLHKKIWLKLYDIWGISIW